MKRKFVLALVASMAMLGAKADGPFRNARWDSFHCLKPAGTDIVFVGNSITNMHQWWEALGGQNNVLNRGTSGGFTTEVLSNLEAITAGHPKKVFIGIGTNDICEVLSLETTADNVRIIAERIARECPETEVYIQSLIPSTSDGNHVPGGGRNGRVLQVNALIQAHAEALAAKGLNVTYLDVNTPLRDPNNPNALKTSKFGQKIAFDDLHPNAVGYKYWLDTIKEETGYDCIYEEKEMPRPMNNNVYDDCLSGFEQFKVSGDDILMVGGDMIHNGEWHEFMKSGHFKNRGMGWGLYGITIANLNTIVERSLAADGSVDPKAIVIYAGDKDSNNGTAAATQFEAYKTAIEGIKAKAPTSKIFVLSAMPNTDNTKNGIVQELNSKMKAYAAQGDYTFVDAYAEIATNRQLYMNNTGYVYTRGYAKIAQVLAESLNAKLGTHYNPITDEEAEANVNTYNARTTLGNAVTSALRVLGKEGEGVGQYPASALTGISDKTNNAFSILSAASFDATAAATAAEELRNLNVSATPNLPLASTANAEHWYTLVSSQRGSRYVGSNGTRTIGYSDGNVFARNQWKFVARGENSFDIINRQDNRYLAPSSNNASLALSADQPANGWEFSYGVTAGTFIIQNGTCEINMTDQADGTNKKVVNWSTNYAGNDHSDPGCQFTIEEYTGDASSVIYLPVSSTDSENHFYTIQSKRGGRYVTKSESDVRGIAETSNGAYWRFYDRGDGTYNVKAVNETYLNPADGQTSISAPEVGWTLSASNEAGYVILKSGSNQLHQYNSGQYLLGNYGNGTNLGDEGCQFRIAAYEGDVQLEEAPEVVLPTEDANVIVSPNNGTGVGSSYTKQWISNDKLVTISVGANNMTANNGNIDFRSGQAKSATYTITPADGYYVSGYSFVTTGASTITITGNGSTATASAEGTPFTATVTEGTTASFTVADNANSQNVLSNFHVRLTPVGAQPSTNIDGSELAPVVYTIANYVANPQTTRYLMNENGTLKLAEASTLDASDSKYQWTLRANGSNYDIVSVADGKVLDYAKGLSVAGTPFAMGEGTTPEYTSLHNSVMGGGRYLAASADGTRFGTTNGNYYANQKVQTNGWSTDFVFEVVNTEETTDGYIIDKANGELYKNGAVSTGFCSQWKSSDNAVTFTSNANNMQWAVSDTNHIDARSGGTKNATYTLASTNPEYVIESYSFKAKALTSNQTWKQGSNTYTATTSGVITIADDNVDEQAVQFTLTDADNSGTLLTDFTVKLKKVELDPALAEPEKMTVLDNAHSSVPYRIPAIASTKDGVLVVAADYRFTKADIGGGRLDLHIRRSFDYGKTWEDKIIKPENMIGDGNCSNHNDYAGFGDPCIVADRESSKMMILSCAGYPGFFQCTRDQHQRCARWYSEDNGATWTGPEFIDNQFVFEPLDNNSFGPAQGMFFGSGKIHQSRYVKVKDYYRLYASNSVRNSGGTIRNYVMYSDDFGQTWNFLGGVDAPAVSSGGDEPKVEELPDGSVLFSGRRNNAGGRNFNIFRFSNDAKTEGQWLGNTVSNANVNGITNDNACNGEIQLVPVVRKKDNQKMWLALQSVPFGSGRNNVGIFYKPLITEADYATPAAIASNWEGKHQSSWTSSCYSTMVLQGDKNIGFVYEENGNNGGYDIQYKNYSIEVITKGKYGFDPDYAMPDVVLPLHAAGYTPAAGTVEKVETITVQYNKPLTLKQANVTLGDGVVASASVEGNVLTLTLANAITSGGKHELTIPAGVVADNDAQVNDPVSITYRIIGEEQPLGDQVTSLEGISNFKTYALYNPASKGYATYAPQQSTSMMWAGEMQDMDANHQVKNTAYSVDVNHADPNSAWMIVNYKGSTYLYNVGAEKFVSVGRPTTLGDAKAINIAKIENGFTFITNEGAQNYMCASPQLDQPVTTWTNTDNGSCWQLIENPNVEEDYERCISLIDSSFLLGDANGNTTLEREDVGSLIDYLLVRREDEAPAQCDVNKDTMISIGDVARLIRRLLESAKK